jgi:hypothetical protein
LFERAAKERWSGKQWVAASSSRADASTWRRIITWPFGEEGGVFRFNKAGDGLYVLSSLGRWARVALHWAARAAVLSAGARPVGRVC